MIDEKQPINLNHPLSKGLVWARWSDGNKRYSWHRDFGFQAYDKSVFRDLSGNGNHGQLK